MLKNKKFDLMHRAGEIIKANLLKPSKLDMVIMQSYEMSQNDKIANEVKSKSVVLNHSALSKVDCFIFSAVSIMEIYQRSPLFEKMHLTSQSMDFSRKMRAVCGEIGKAIDPEDLSRVFNNRIYAYDYIVSTYGLTEKMSNVLKIFLAKDFYHHDKDGVDDVVLEDDYSPAVPPGSKMDIDFQNQCDEFAAYVWGNAMNLYGL